MFNPYIYTLATLLIPITSVLVGIFVFVKSPKSPINRQFFLMSIAIALWSFFLFLLCFVGLYGNFSQDQARILVAALHFCSIFIPALFFHLVLRLIGIEHQYKAIMRGIYAITGFVACLHFSKLMFSLPVSKYGFKYWVEPSVLYPLHIGLFSFLIAYGYYLLTVNYQKASGNKKTQLFYFIIATFIGFLGGINDYLLNYNFNLHPFSSHGHYLIIAYILIITYAILKHHLMDINVVIRKGVVYSVLIGSITGIYLFAINIINKYMTNIDWKAKVSYQQILSSIPMGFYQWTLLLTAILSLFLSVLVFRKNRSKAGGWFSVFALLVSSWAYLYYLGMYYDDFNKCSFYLRTNMIPGILILPTFTEFVHAFLNIKMNKYVRTINWLVALLLVPTVYSNLYCKTVGPFVGFVSVLNVAPLGYINIIQYLFNVIYSEYKLIKSLGLRESNYDRQIKYLIYSTCIGFLGAATSFLLWFNVPFPPVLNVLIPVYIFMVAFAILKHQLMDIEIIIRKGLLYSLLVALLSGIYVSVVILYGNYLGGRKNTASMLFTVISITFFSIIFQPLRDRVQNFIDKVFFRGKYDYQRTLKGLSIAARSIAGIDELADKMLSSIVNVIQIDKAALFVLDKNACAFFPRKVIGERVDEMPHALISRLQIGKEPVVTDGLAEMNEQEYAIIFPMITKDELIGMLCLGEKLSGEAYSDEDIDLLTTLCNQMGASIENAMLYEDALEAQKKLYQADKLATVGALAAGLAHEIKNPIAAIKGFSQVIDKAVIEKDAEAIKDFKDVVPRQLDRINDIVEKLLTLSKPPKLEIKKVEINALLDDIVKLVEKQAMKQKVEIINSFDELPGTMADPEQLTQAFLNLLLNGVQSMPEGGQIEIRTRFMGTDKIEIEFIDNGIGISKEKLSKIFDPFYTTKSGGSGLGLSVTQKIIIDHHGTINVQSEPGKGTKFKIILPVK